MCRQESSGAELYHGGWTRNCDDGREGFQDEGEVGWVSRESGVQIEGSLKIDRQGKNWQEREGEGGGHEEELLTHPGFSSTDAESQLSYINAPLTEGFCLFSPYQAPQEVLIF